LRRTQLFHLINRNRFLDEGGIHLAEEHRQCFAADEDKDEKDEQNGGK